MIAGVVAILLGFLAYWFFGTGPATNPVQGNPSTNFPSAGTVPNGTSQGNSLTVAEIQQGSITVRNFKDDPTTVPDTHNAGYYYLAGGINPAITHPPYQVFYDEAHQYFGITLYKEPLGQYRKEAEQSLTKSLGLTQDQMCRLNYFIGTAPGVDDLYLAKNLGFSFCPGATALP
jgi:hypothetical protein